MAVKIKSSNRQNLDIIFERLKKITRIEKNDMVVYDGIGHFRLEWMLLSIIEFGFSLSPSSQKKILDSSLKEIALKNDHSVDFFITQLNKYLRQHNKKKKKTYQLLASLSIKNLPFRKINLGSSKIIIHGKKFPKPQNKARTELIQLQRFKPDNLEYTKVSVIQESRNFEDAYKESIETLEVFRSFLCLLLNKEFEIKFGNRDSRPINKICAGEIFSLHFDNGECVDKNHYWFTPSYKETEILELKNTQKKNLRINIRHLVKHYNKCNLKHQLSIRKAMNIYVSAFDEKNKNICFLKAWTVLETLLDTDQNDTLIKRISSMYKSREFITQELECLRQYRNEFVHNGNDELEADMACYRTQKFIFETIKFNFKYSGFFTNINEVGYFLDSYSPNLRELETRKRILDRAIKLKERTTTPS